MCNIPTIDRESLFHHVIRSYMAVATKPGWKNPIHQIDIYGVLVYHFSDNHFLLHR